MKDCCDWGDCPNPAEYTCGECGMALCDDCRFNSIADTGECMERCGRCMSRGDDEP